MIGSTRLKLQDGVCAGPNPDVENHNRLGHSYNVRSDDAGAKSGWGMFGTATRYFIAYARLPTSPPPNGFSSQSFAPVPSFSLPSRFTAPQPLPSSKLQN
jgi:hypothetical protein